MSYNPYNDPDPRWHDFEQQRRIADLHQRQLEVLEEQQRAQQLTMDDAAHNARAEQKAVDKRVDQILREYKREKRRKEYPGLERTGHFVAAFALLFGALLAFSWTVYFGWFDKGWKADVGIATKWFMYAVALLCVIFGVGKLIHAITNSEARGEEAAGCVFLIAAIIAGIIFAVVA